MIEAELGMGESLSVEDDGPMVPSPQPIPGGRVLRVGLHETYAHLADLPVLGPGDLVELTAGNWREAATIHVEGASGNPARILASPGASLDGSGLDLSGRSGPRALIEVIGSHAIVQGMECSHARNSEGNAAGIRIVDGEDIQLRWCSVHECDVGILVNHAGAVSLENTRALMRERGSRPCVRIRQSHCRS